MEEIGIIILTRQISLPTTGEFARLLFKYDSERNIYAKEQVKVFPEHERCLYCEGLRSTRPPAQAGAAQ